MKAEKRTLIFSAFINLFVAIIKILSGIFFNFSSIIADGFYTFSDLITDVLAMIGAKISKKRPNKRYPLGYGNYEYIMQMIIGFVIFLVGLVVIFMGLKVKYSRPDLLVVMPIILVIGLKVYSSKILFKVGNRINSNILITSSKESFIDAMSSGILILVICSSFIFPKADMVGSVLIGLMIIYQAIKIIGENIGLLIGENIKDDKIEETLQDIFKNYKKIIFNSYTLIKRGMYSQLIINVSLAKDYTVKSLINAEANIKKEIIARKTGIKFIEFDIDQKLIN